MLHGYRFYHMHIVMIMLLTFSTVSCGSQKIGVERGPVHTMVCNHCNGTGTVRFCPKCGGTGSVRPNPKGGPDWAVGICPLCHGKKGMMEQHKCDKCNGTGNVRITD